MKTLFTLLLFFFCTIMSSAAQNIEPAPADKAVVYFVRTSSLGFAINFTYLDSTRVIGKFNGPKYIRYECEPGVHLFWARSENRDFIEAEVEAGKIYFIEADVKMGAVKAAVELIPVDPKDSKKMNRILKFISKKPSEYFTVAELEDETNKMQDVITRGLDKYRSDKEKGKGTARLEKSMFYGE